MVAGILLICLDTGKEFTIFMGYLFQIKLQGMLSLDLNISETSLLLLMVLHHNIFDKLSSCFLELVYYYITSVVLSPMVLNNRNLYWKRILCKHIIFPLQMKVS